MILGSKRGWEDGEEYWVSEMSSGVFQIPPNPAVPVDGAAGGEL